MSYVVVPQPGSMSGIGCLRGAMGTNGDSGTSASGSVVSPFAFTNVARVALVFAGAAILLTMLKRRSPMQANMLTPWADIGPLFAASLALGPAFALTHYL